MNRYSVYTDKISKHLDKLSDYSASSYEVLSEAQKYSLVSGGKHLRGLLLMQTAMLGGVEADKLLNFACAIEMVHTYSLIHDDLPEMDNDDLRRGVPTCHKKFGHAIALLAGDALITKTFNIISNDSYFSSDTKLRCISILSEACGEHGMLAGQTIDKICENKSISFELLNELHARKTGDMFAAAVKMGCVLGNVDKRVENNLVSYIADLGLAFQIKDDILDVVSTSEQLGKPVNSDEKSAKSTFVSMLGLEKSDLLLKQTVQRAKDSVKDIQAPFFSILADYFVNRTK